MAEHTGSIINMKNYTAKSENNKEKNENYGQNHDTNSRVDFSGGLNRAEKGVRILAASVGITAYEARASSASESYHTSWRQIFRKQQWVSRCTHERCAASRYNDKVPFKRDSGGLQFIEDIIMARPL